MVSRSRRPRPTQHQPRCWPECRWRCAETLVEAVASRGSGTCGPTEQPSRSRRMPTGRRSELGSESPRALVRATPEWSRVTRSKGTCQRKRSGGCSTSGPLRSAFRSPACRPTHPAWAATQGVGMRRRCSSSASMVRSLTSSSERPNLTAFAASFVSSGGAPPSPIPAVPRSTPVLTAPFTVWGDGSNPHDCS